MKKNYMVIIGIVSLVMIIFVIWQVYSSSTSTKTEIQPTTPIKTEIPQTTTYDLSIAKINDSSQYKGRITIIPASIEGKIEPIAIPIDAALFNIDYKLDENYTIQSVLISLKPDLMDFYHQVGFFNRPANTVIVYPLFTEVAYGPNGFYDYYNKKCNTECLTVKISDVINPVYQSSRSGFLVLRSLNYDYVTDADVDKNPYILKKYDRVIVLHNEYVTQNEFNAITSHPNVVYLYPNALYAKVNSNYATNTITLIRGHGYPSQDVSNGFGWEFDNSKYEYDIKCDNWKFYKVENGKMLNCYPSYKMYFDKSLLGEILN